MTHNQLEIDIYYSNLDWKMVIQGLLNSSLVLNSHGDTQHPKELERDFSRLIKVLVNDLISTTSRFPVLNRSINVILWTKMRVILEPKNIIFGYILLALWCSQSRNTGDRKCSRPELNPSFSRFLVDTFPAQPTELQLNLVLGYCFTFNNEYFPLPNVGLATKFGGNSREA